MYGEEDINGAVSAGELLEFQPVMTSTAGLVCACVHGERVRITVQETRFARKKKKKVTFSYPILIFSDP